MKKQDIHTLLHITDATKQDEILEKIAISSSTASDSVSRKVWWVITEQELNNLSSYWKWETRGDMSKETRNTIRKTGIDIIRALSARNGGWDIKPIDDSNQVQLWDSWVALEYFLLDTLLRTDWTDSTIQFEKWPRELDAEKVDFISRAWSIVFGNQVTVRGWKKYWELIKKRNKIDTGNKRSKKRDYISIKLTTDIPVLLDINWKIKSTVWSEWDTTDTSFKKAYLQWKEDWFPYGWPFQYLDTKTQKELNIIATTYREILQWLLLFLKEGNLATKHTKTKKDSWWNKLQIQYHQYEWIYQVSVFPPHSKSWESPLYTITFFLTQKWLDKLEN